MWVADVGRDASMPLEQVHVAIYGYYPQAARDEARPYVWRLLAPSRMLIGSHLRPSAPSAREVFARHGMTYDFRLTFKRVRNVGGTTVRPDGERRKRKGRAIEMRDHDEIKDRLIRFAGERGGDVRYVRVEAMREVRIGLARLPICDAIGKVYVRDPIAFERLLCSGGPGTGKAYGLGMWYLPEIMEVADAAA